MLKNKKKINLKEDLIKNKNITKIPTTKEVKKELKKKK